MSSFLLQNTIIIPIQLNFVSQSFSKAVVLTKIIPSIRDLPYEVRLQKLKLPTLAYRRLRGDMIQVYKIMHGLNRMNKSTLFTMKDADKNLRGHDLMIQKQHAHLDIRKYSFTNRVVNTWNRLPKAAVNAPTVNSFKTAVDVFLTSKYDKYSFMSCNKL